MSFRPAVLLGVLVAGAFFGGGYLLRRDPRERNLEMLPADMVRSPAPKSGTYTDAFPDRLVQRHAPEGTVARDATVPVYGKTPEEAARAGAELENPLPASAAVLARGAKVFQTRCACCHGPAGLGDGPVTKRGFPPPPSFLRPESRALRDGEIFHAITYGRKDMPSHAGQVERDDRWRVIRFVRSLQERAP